MISGVVKDDIRAFLVQPNQPIGEDLLVFTIYSSGMMTAVSIEIPDQGRMYVQIPVRQYGGNQAGHLQLPQAIYAPKGTKFKADTNQSIHIQAIKVHEEHRVPISELREEQAKYKKDLEEVKNAIAKAAVDALEDYALSELRQQIVENITDEVALPEGFKAAMKSYIENYLDQREGQ